MSKGQPKLAPIAELIEKVASWNPVRDAPDEEFAYIDLSAVDNETKAVTSTQHLRGCDAPSRARQRVKSGDILVSTVRPNLNGVARIPGELDGATASTGFCVLRPKPSKLDGSYLFHWVRSSEFVADMVRKATGASYPAVSDKIIGHSEIPLPPLEEQKRIAAILDQADDLRRKRQRALDSLNQLGQAIFIEMFGDPAHKDTKTSELSSFLKFITSGGRGWSKYYADSGTRFIRSFDVQMNNISSADPAFVLAPDNAEARRTAVQSGDVLLTITGSKIGRVAAVPSDFGAAFVSQHVAILRADTKRLRPEFLAFFLSLPSGGQIQIEKNQYGQTKPGLNFEQIGRFLIPAVDIDGQEQFVAAIKKVESISGHSVSAQILEDNLFTSLQHRAFRGELTAPR